MARTTKLNDIQLRLIQMFEFTTSKKGEEELMKLLQNAYLKKFNEEKKRMKAEGKLDLRKINEYLRTHHHGKPIQA